jgi:hypothetical protein
MSLLTHKTVKIELTPSINKVLNILDPTTFPILKSFRSLIAALMLTDASGALVPIDTNVNPMIKEGILKNLAILLEPSTKKSAPLINRNIPTTNKTQLNNI